MDDAGVWPHGALVTEGEFAGWRRFEGLDPFEDTIGPFHFRREADGSTRCAFKVERRHLNGGGAVHGGCLMSFADYALFMIAADALDGAYGVTVTFDAQFVSAGREGEVIEAEGEVVRAGGSLIFVRGTLSAGGRGVLSFNGVIKRLHR